jgi:hypothetical protein
VAPRGALINVLPLRGYRLRIEYCRRRSSPAAFPGDIRNLDRSNIEVDRE